MATTSTSKTGYMGKVNKYSRQSQDGHNAKAYAPMVSTGVKNSVAQEFYFHPRHVRNRCKTGARVCPPLHIFGKQSDCRSGLPTCPPNPTKGRPHHTPPPSLLPPPSIHLLVPKGRNLLLPFCTPCRASGDLMRSETEFIKYGFKKKKKIRMGKGNLEGGDSGFWIETSMQKQVGMETNTPPQLDRVSAIRIYSESHSSVCEGGIMTRVFSEHTLIVLFPHLGTPALCNIWMKVTVLPRKPQPYLILLRKIT